MRPLLRSDIARSVSHPVRRRATALLGAFAWIALAIGTVGHGATPTAGEMAPLEAFHHAVNCPICQAPSSFIAVQPELASALVAPELPRDSYIGIAPAPRRAAARHDLARAPPASLIT